MATARRAHRRTCRVVPVSAALSACTLLLAVVAPASSSAAPQASLAEVRQQVAALGQQISRLSEQYDAATIQLGTARLQEAVLRARLHREQAQFDAVQADLSRFASAAYRSGGLGGELMAILTSDSTSFLDRSLALNALSQHHAETLAAARTARHRVADAEAGARVAVQRQQEAQRSLAKKRVAISHLLAAQQAQLNRLEAAARERYNAERNAEASRLAALRGSYNGPASGRAAVAVRFAYAQLGKPYQWGASGPNSYDCSGLTMRAWEAAGVSLPHYTEAQRQATRPVARADLQPGDLVFFGSPAYHMGIYIGDGKMIEAPHTGDVVKIASIDRSSYSGAGRP